MIQIWGTVLFFVVFILLFIALIFYISITVQRLLQESRLRDKMRRGVHLTDMVALVTAIPDAVLIVSPSGLIVQANHAAIALFGYLDLLGQQVEILIPERVQQRHREHRSHYFANPKVRRMGEGLALAGVRCDGTQFPVEVSLSPLMVNGEPHAVAIIREKQEQEEKC